MLGFLDYAKIAIGVLVGIALATLYVAVIHDPKIISQARTGYVELAEKTTAQAQVAEMQRQRDAAAQALTEADKREQADKQADDARQIQTQTEITDYEQKLAASNRQCLLDDSDVEFLQAH